MSISKKVILKVDRRNPKLGYLKLRTIENRKSKEKTLKRKIQVKHWNANTMLVRSTEPYAKQINKEIQEALKSNPDAKISNSKESREKSYIKFAEKRLDIIQPKSTRDVKLYAINKLKEFLKNEEGRDDLLFTDITPFFIEQFYNYLKDTMNKKSSANAYMINFRYFVNEADKYGEYIYQRDPFKNFKTKRENIPHDVMTPHEVNLFFEYEPKDRSYLYVQSAFGFMMHCAGMRISDLLNLKWNKFKEQGDSYVIEYKMQKTDKRMHPKLSLEALEYLIPFIEDYGEDYLVGYRNFKKRVNKGKKELKKLRAELKKLEPITIYEIYMSGKEKYDEKLKEAMEFHKKENQLKQQIQIWSKAVEFNTKSLMQILANTCIILQEKFPNDFVIPDCRDVPKENLQQVQHAIKIRYNYRLQQIQKEQEIKTKITNHQARHIFAQRLFEAGANFHYISLALGHASLQITESYREQLINDDAKDVVEVFSDLFREKNDIDEEIKQDYIKLSDDFIKKNSDLFSLQPIFKRK